MPFMCRLYFFTFGQDFKFLTMKIDFENNMACQAVKADKIMKLRELSGSITLMSQ